MFCEDDAFASGNHFCTACKNLQENDESLYLYHCMFMNMCVSSMVCMYVEMNVESYNSVCGIYEGACLCILVVVVVVFHYLLLSYIL